MQRLPQQVLLHLLLGQMCNNWRHPLLGTQQQQQQQQWQPAG
jgi:hypothetical protein